MSSDSDKKQYEYSTQFFGTQPDVLSCYVTGPIRENALIANIDSLVRSVNACGKLTVPEENIESFKSALLNKTDKTLTKLDAYLNDKIFCVPGHVLLPGDEIQKEQFTTADIDALKLEIEKIKQEIRNEKYMQAAMAAEMEEIERTKRALEPIQSRINAIKSNMCLDELRVCVEHLQKSEMAVAVLPQTSVKVCGKRTSEHLDPTKSNC